MCKCSNSDKCFDQETKKSRGYPWEPVQITFKNMITNLRYIFANIGFE